MDPAARAAPAGQRHRHPDLAAKKRGEHDAEAGGEAERCAQSRYEQAEDLISEAEERAKHPPATKTAETAATPGPETTADGDLVQDDDLESMLSRAEALLQEVSGREGSEEEGSRALRAQGLFLAARIRLARKEPGATDLLSRAVKLDPQNAQAWNCLAEVLWREGNLEEARDCLLSSLEQGPEKATLRNYSMLLRKLRGTSSEKADNMSESLKRAKAAVALDLSDAESWYVLGNTYMAHFFALSHDLKDLEASLKAYRRSEDLCGGAANPDLFYNRAQVLAFVGNYASAVADYERAHALDASLGADARAKALSSRVKSIALTVARKGRVKPKRLQALQASFSASANADGAVAGKALRDLTAGPNAGARIEVKFLSNMGTFESPPATFLALDRAGQVFAVSMFHLDNVAQDRLVGSRERLELCNPLFRTVELDGCAYPSVQVQHPAHVLVNGKALGSSFAHAALASSTI